MIVATQSTELIARGIHEGRIPLADAAGWVARFEADPSSAARALSASPASAVTASDSRLEFDRAMAGEGGVILLLARMWS